MKISTTEKSRLLLDAMTVDELRCEFEVVVGFKSKSRNRQYLTRKILWFKQAEVEGGISDLAIQRAQAIADFRDLFHHLPSKPQKSTKAAPNKSSRQQMAARDERIPIAGSVISREYQSRKISVLVLEGGFEWDNAFYKSLSAVARADTGTRWNGHLFFRLGKEASDAA